MPDTKNLKVNTNSSAAGFGIRLVAYLIDLIILGIVGAMWRALFGQTAYNLVSFVVGAAYAVLLWVNWNGQTVGKKLMKIKVVMEDGKNVNYQAAVLRYLGYIISAIPLFIGFFWIIWDQKKQGWHDKIAKTIVVKE